MKKRPFVAFLLLAGALLAACDTSTPAATPTAVVSGAPASTTAAASTAAPAQTASSTLPGGGGPGGQAIDASPVVTSSTPLAAEPSGTPATPSPTTTPEVVVSDTVSSVITETRLTDIDASQWIQDSFTVSPDRKHVGYIAASGTKFVMYTDRTRSSEYVGILDNTLSFSEDGKHYAYGAVKNTNFGAKGLVVVDGVEQKGRYDAIENGLVISPDGLRVAYGAARNDKHFVVVDGKEDSEYDAVVKASIRFSPDSKHVGYAAGPDGAQFIVLDGQQQKIYGDVLNLAFSPDSKHVAYLAVTGGITATLTQTALNPGAAPEPSPVPGKRVLVLDGKEGKGYQGFNPNSLVFSPDSKHVAFIVQQGVKQFVVVDGIEGPSYDILGGVPEFSPDSKKLAYAACQGTCTTAKDSKWRIVVHDVSDAGISPQGREGSQYEAMGSTAVFSPDSRYLAYVGSTGGKQFVVVERNLSGDLSGAEGTHYDGIGRGTIVFSPDSMRLAYVAGANSKQFVVVDSQRGPDYDSIGRGTPVFSTDGKHIAYSATTNNKQTIVLDGKPGQEFDVAGKGGVVPYGPSGFYYLGISNNLSLRVGTVWLVEQRIK